MSEKIYVGNLSWNTTENDLENLFTQYGEVMSIQLIMDRETNRSKGFGFIEMADGNAAEASISAFNGTDLDGRNIRVNKAENREPRRGNNHRY